MLSNVLLRTEDAGLKLTATNLEIGITAWVPGKIDSEGSLTVPARLFTDIVSRPAGRRAGRPRAGRERHTLRIRAGRYQTHLRGIDADEFPVIPSPGERPTTRVTQKVLRKALAEVVFAAATDEARPDPDRRAHPVLGRQGSPSPRPTTTASPSTRCRSRIRSRRARWSCRPSSYAELMRVLTDTDDPVEIMLASAKSQVLFHLEGIDLVSRLIDGQFPNYQQVLPTSHGTRAVVDRDELLKAVRLSALIASSAANVIKLRLGDEGSDGDHRLPRRPMSATPRPRSRRRSRAIRSRSLSTRATCRMRCRTSTPNSWRSSSRDRSRRACCAVSATTTTST